LATSFGCRKSNKLCPVKLAYSEDIQLKSVL
jgi:hypothetical protein